MLANSKAKHLALNRMFLLRYRRWWLSDLGGVHRPPMFITPPVCLMPPYIQMPPYVQIVLVSYIIKCFTYI